MMVFLAAVVFVEIFQERPEDAHDFLNQRTYFLFIRHYAVLPYIFYIMHLLLENQKLQNLQGEAEYQPGITATNSPLVANKSGQLAEEK